MSIYALRIDVNTYSRKDALFFLGTMGEPKRHEQMKSITVRVDEGTFRRLEDKRFADKTSFQAVGEAFFNQWLDGAGVGTQPLLRTRDSNLTEMCGWIEHVLTAPERDLQDYEKAALTILRFAWEQEKHNRDK